MSSANTMPGTIAANTLRDPEGPDGEHRLTPYVVIGGPNQYSTDRPSFEPASYLETNSPFVPIKRFTLAVAPLQGTGLNYPNEGGDKWMLNLDSEQLYTAPRDNSTDYGFAFGKVWSDPSELDPDDCKQKYRTDDGAYTTPVPVQGLPIEFRKIYFRGTEVDEYGCTSGSGSGACSTYYAYLPCSLPVKQTCASGTGASGFVCNPRNENYGLMDGEVVEWSGFDIGCGGGGGGGCSDSYSIISGATAGTLSGSGWYASGCESILSFETSGCSGFGVTITGTGDGNTNVIFYLTGDSCSGGSGCSDTFRRFHTWVTGEGGHITGEDGNYNNGHNAEGCDASFGFRGVSGARTLIHGGGVNPYVAIAPPVFTASGCLTVDTDTHTKRVTYGFDRDDIISCLGYQERIIQVVVTTGSPAFAQGQPITSLSGEDGRPYFTVCNQVFLTTCPDDDEIFLTGCCETPVGPCCINGSCSTMSEAECEAAGGTFYGEGNLCSSSAGDGNAPYYDYTFAELCQTGIGCVYNSDYDDGGVNLIGYECYNGGLGSHTTRAAYLNHIDSDSKYSADEAAGGLLPSTFEVGGSCDPNPCPTTTSTTTSSSTSSSSTTFL